MAYLLSISLDQTRLAEILAASAPDDWTVSLIDGRDHIVARSRLNDRFAGSEATASLREKAVGPSGTWNALTLEGTRVYGAHTLSDMSGWRVAVGVLPR